MKKNFKLLLVIGLSGLLWTSYTFAYSQERQDAYNRAYKYGITTQSTIEEAKMNSPLTRQAFAKMLVKYLENVVWIKSTTNSCSFPDESKITNELRFYAKKICAYGIMWTNWKNFNPTQPVDRAQLWTVFSRILRGDRYNLNGNWYYTYHLETLKAYGIMNNINNPTAFHAKRWDVLIMFKRTFQKFGSDIYLNKPTSTDSSITATLSGDAEDRDTTRKNDLAKIQTAVITSQQDRWNWPGMKWSKDQNSRFSYDNLWEFWFSEADKWAKISDIYTNLSRAWLSPIPKDPINTTLVYWLWENYRDKTSAKNNWAMGDYIYLVSIRNWVTNGWFALMAKTETEGKSNRVVCKNGQWVDDWYITYDTDLAKIYICKNITKWTICSSNAANCTYTDEEELRYILLY